MMILYLFSIILFLSEVAETIDITSATQSSAFTASVTLSHGGSLRGLTTVFQSVPVDVFLGVRYAKPPIGELRFKKPELVPSWKGVKNATKIGNKCPQLGPGGVEGSEDCLFMDITVPRQGPPGEKKAVMVWIHGGAFSFGAGSTFIGTPLAVMGDVVMVTFNYRIGMLGFLYDGPGTGNYGLWDQRVALVWVKQNIERFGGDPNRVTIFGQSAGGGSVSAQIVGQHSEGLFKRAITQSGTLYQLLPHMKSRIREMVESVKKQTSCTSAKVYECLTHMTPTQLLTTISLDPSQNFWHPVSDNDFFTTDVDEYSYKLGQRFELMSGINEQDGGIILGTDTTPFAAALNMTLDNGISLKFARQYLNNRCPTWFTPFSAELCTEFVVNTYGLDSTDDDKERLIRLVAFLNEAFFNADTLNQLEQHSGGDKSTYAYYFTELLPSAQAFWKVPDWLKVAADHCDELEFLFGGVYYKEENNSLWNSIMDADPLMKSLVVGSTGESDKPLIRKVMTMWTNFAKTGNPNKPVEISANDVEWPQFTTQTSSFLEINSQSMRVITAPNRERLHKLTTHLFSARRRQFSVDIPAKQDNIKWKSKKMKHEEL